MKKSRVVLFGVVIVVVIGLAVWAGIMIAGGSSATNANSPSPYSAVYLSSGDIYFGKFSSWPSPRMTDVWYLSRTQGANNQTQVSVQPMKAVFWGPGNEIDLNANDIIFSTRLMNNSQVVQIMENPPAAQNQQQSSSTSSAGAPSTSPAVSATSSAPSVPSGK